MAFLVGPRSSEDEQGTDETDIMIGHEGSDFMFGGGGNDLLFGGAGDDIMLGGAGNDILIGGTGDNYMDGGTGNDILISGAGVDTMDGGEGTDVFFMGAGDIATGGAGADVFYFRIQEAGDITVTDFNPEEGDRMVIRAPDDLEWSVSEDLGKTVVTFEDGLSLTLAGVTAEEVLEDPGLFGLG